MLLSVVSNLVNSIKEVDFQSVSTLVVNVASVIVLVLSALGRIKTFIKDCKDTTNAIAKKVEEKTREQVEEVKLSLKSMEDKLDLKLEELKQRETEMDAKLTKIMKKDPISKYKYGEVKEYVPEVATYVAQPVEEKVEEVEVEVTPLVETTPLLKKKRKAKTSFVD